MVPYNKQAIPFKAGVVDVGGCVWESICLKARLHRVGVCTCQRVDVGQWMCGRVDVRQWMCGRVDVGQWMCQRVDVGQWMCQRVDVGQWMCGRVDVGQWMCGRVNVRGLIDVWEVVSPEARLHRVDVGRWMWVPQLTGLYMPCPQRNLAMIS